MDEIEQSNKKHLASKSGRKFRENNKAKLNKVEYKDSRGQSFKKSKKTVNKVNAKAFAIQNIAKAKKKVALVVDRQTKKHTFSYLSDQYAEAPQLICLVGPQNSGKSTLLRTLMRHYTGHRMTINGPVTVVTSKKKKVTFFECPNDLNSMVDVAKIADMILLMINIKQGIQNETFEFLEILSTHGAPRIKIIFTHLDEFQKNDVKLQKKIKLCTKRIQLEVHALPFRLTEFKTFRKAGNSEYKIEEVKNLARLIGQKNPRPNDWRQNHPYILVDRMEKITKEKLNFEKDLDDIKFYGYVRGCTMLSDLTHMHLMGVGDFVINPLEPLNEPCPTPYQESKTPQKRQPLEIKERKAYAPMSGYGGVLKDFDGFHILSASNGKENDKSQKNKFSDDDEMDNENVQVVPSSLIKELSDSDDSEDEEMSSDDMDTNESVKKKKNCNGNDLDETKTLVRGFEELQNEMKTENDRINYERLIYDEDYVCNLSALDKLRNVQKELSIDLFVTGKWDKSEDAATLLKKDDERLKKETNKNLKMYKKDKIRDKYDENDDDFEKDNETKMEVDDDIDIDDEEDLETDNDIEMDEIDEEEEGEEFDDEIEQDTEEEDDNDDESDEDNEEEDDESDEDTEEDDESDEEGKDIKQEKKSSDLFDGLVQDTAALTDFQKKKLERSSKTKREKKLEKKAKHKALFDKLYDQKQGDSVTNNFFDKWKEAKDKQEEKNKVAFQHLDADEAYKFSGLNPGTYVCLIIKKVPKEFFNNFNAKKPVILGALSPGEEANAVMTASFKLSRHFDIKEVFKTEDPLCLSLGWRRFQTFCYFFKEEDNLRNTFLKYSSKKFQHCKVAFYGPVVPVKTGFNAFIDFEHHEKFRLAAVGSVLSKGDSVKVEKKLKRIGEPFKIFKNTAFIKGMFGDDLEVVEYENALLKTSSGIRGCIKKSLNGKEYGPGSFRATFEAPIFMSDLVSLTGWVTIKIWNHCKNISNLLLGPEEKFVYWKLWNQYYKENNIPLPSDHQNSDSKYKKIERKPFNPAPIKFSKKVINQLPFINRPVEDTPADLFQKNRPKVVLDVNESKKAQLMDSLMYTKEERMKKLVDAKQKYGTIKQKKLKQEEEKELAKKKKKSKIFFKNKSLKAGEAKRKPVKKDE